MVLSERLSEELQRKTKNNKNEVSTDSDYIDSDHCQDDDSTTSPQEEEDINSCLDIAEIDDQPSGIYGNIVVKNSSEVHFGNKTFYQGPVTIKQFLYNNSSNEQLGITNGDVSQIVNGDANNFTQLKHVENDTKNFDNDSDITISFKETSNKEEHRIADTQSKWIALKKNYLAFTVICAIALFFIILVIVLMTSPLTSISSQNSSGNGVPIDSSEQDKREPIDWSLGPDTNLTLSGKLRIISRREWLAQPPAQQPTKLKTPVPFVIILHTATENCTDQASCVFHVRYIQTYHIDSYHWWDIGYSFLVGGDGFAYEGRGWQNEGAFTFGYNARAIGIAFIGTFNDILPSARQILAAKQLIQLGVEKGYIDKNYKLFAHRQLSTTQSPGTVLYNDIKAWPHWSSTPDDGINDSKTITTVNTNITTVISTEASSLKNYTSNPKIE